MATFPDYPKDLTQRLQQTAPHLSADELKQITQVLKDYEAARNDGLSRILDVISDMDDDEKTGAVNDAVSAASTRQAQLLNNMLNGLQNPTSDAILFRTQTACEDAAFMRSLAAHDLGGARDTMLRFKTRLNKMMDDLDAVWSTTSGQDKDLEDLEKQAAADLTKILNDTLQANLPLYAKASELAYDATEKIKNAPKLAAQFIKVCVQTIADSMEDAIEGARGFNPDSASAPESTEEAPAGISEFMDDWEQLPEGTKELFEFAKSQGVEAKDLAKLYKTQNLEMLIGDKLDDAIQKVCGSVVGNDAAGAITLLLLGFAECKKATYMLLQPYAEAKRRYLDQLPKQGVVLVCFTRSRKMVNDFIDKNGIDAVTKYTDMVKDELNEWAESMSQTSLQHDAAAFGQIAWMALDHRLSEMQTLFVDFVSDSGKRFVGEVNSDLQRELIDMDGWASRVDALANVGLDQRLKDWKNTVLTIQPKFDDAFSQVSSACSGLPVCVQDAVRTRFNAYNTDLKNKITDIQQQLTATVDQVSIVVDRDNIRKCFDRTPLLNMLTSG